MCAFTVSYSYSVFLSVFENVDWRTQISVLQHMFVLTVRVCQKGVGLEKLIPSTWLLQLQKVFTTIGWLAGDRQERNTLFQNTLDC